MDQGRGGMEGGRAVRAARGGPAGRGGGMGAEDEETGAGGGGDYFLSLMSMVW
jgi:hypothetical protein